MYGTNRPWLLLVDDTSSVWHFCKLFPESDMPNWLDMRFRTCEGSIFWLHLRSHQKDQRCRLKLQNVRYFIMDTAVSLFNIRSPIHFIHTYQYQSLTFFTNKNWWALHHSSATLFLPSKVIYYFVSFFFPLIREPLDRKRIEDECLLDRTDTWGHLI